MAFGCLLLSGGLAKASSGSPPKVPSRRGWWKSIISVRPRQSRRRVPSISRPIHKSLFISRDSSRTSGDFRPTPSYCGKTGCAYDFTTDRGAAALNDYACNNDPFAKLGNTQISIDVSSVIRASPESFRVAWTERRYDSGQLAATERWTAIRTELAPRTTTWLAGTVSEAARGVHRSLRYYKNYRTWRSRERSDTSASITTMTFPDKLRWLG